MKRKDNRLEPADAPVGVLVLSGSVLFDIQTHFAHDVLLIFRMALKQDEQPSRNGAAASREADSKIRQF
jgi:hypothetical protein